MNSYYDENKKKILKVKKELKQMKKDITMIDYLYGGNEG